ncbi:MAG: hypothetical protein DRG78_09340 [Epsilonproteobacteria bacterium]|nr:MAG: hypothetical protein DRG78_09340 [Campylobacterota bacterium]
MSYRKLKKTKYQQMVLDHPDMLMFGYVLAILLLVLSIAAIVGIAINILNIIIVGVLAIIIAATLELPFIFAIAMWAEPEGFKGYKYED